MTELNLDVLFQLFGVVMPFVIGYLVKQPAYQKFKTNLHNARQSMVLLDDALYNDEVDEKKYREIFDSIKKSIDEASSK